MGVFHIIGYFGIVCLEVPLHKTIGGMKLDRAKADNGYRFGSLPKNAPLAMAYVPMQRWEKLYEPAAALERGTLFCKLDLPFVGRGAVSDGK